MLKKIVLMCLLSICLSASAMAGSHSGKFTISGTCTAKQFQIRMMGEMPLQFVGEMNCVESLKWQASKWTLIQVVLMQVL